MSIFDFLDNKKRETACTGSPTHIICGLGNPGTQYENTRHNVGFMTIDTIARQLNIQILKLKFKSLTATATFGGTSVLLMKPTTFMNNSGEAVVEALNFYKIPSENLLVICDDISLDVGRVRIRRSGSAGGHNGLKSIIYLSGSDNFPRIKIGVGAKPNPNYDLADWVLSSFKKDEGEKLEFSLKTASEAASLIIKGDGETAMNLYNGCKL